VLAASIAACGGSGGLAPAGAAGSPATPASGAASVASAPTTAAPAPGGGSVPAFCVDYTKAFAQDSAGNMPPLTPAEVALVDRTDAEAPAAVKSDMDVIDASIHQAAKGNTSKEDPATGQDMYAVMTWLGSNCTGVLSTAP
jgi:hypothetical protein